MAYPLKLIPMIDLKPYPGNARRHPTDQIDALKSLIRMAGFTAPIIYDFEADHIIAGHGRLIAATQMLDDGESIPLPGRKGFLPKGKLPTIDGSGMSEAERRAFVIADNKIAQRATWDEQLLEIEFGQLQDMGFDLSLTAFEPDELRPFIEVPKVEPSSLEEQGRLDQKAKTTCPKCGHEF